MDLHDRYLCGMNSLLTSLDTSTEDYSIVLTLQSRLVAAISESRQHGQTELSRAEINRVVTELNRVCLAHLGITFNAFCEIDEIGGSGASQTAPMSPHINWQTYSHRLQSAILTAFSQEHYVMLAVEALESEDPTTLIALQQALRSAFEISVVPDVLGESRQVALEEAVAPHRLVALLGDPGSGKTTSLRSIALRQIESVRTGVSPLIPIWISREVDRQVAIGRGIRLARIQGSAANLGDRAIRVCPHVDVR